MKPLHDAIKQAWQDSGESVEFVNDLRRWLSQNLSPQSRHPVDCVTWVPLESVQANDYNPNSVAPNEMKLLYISIKSDGYTQPVVVVWDERIKKHVIVDGFHRYTVMRIYKDIREACHGMIPVVILSKTVTERMASTVRHNRARGKHSVAGMGSMVFKMLQEKVPDETICNELGLEPDELVRLKHVTGFSKLFDSCEYGKSWVTPEQITHKRNYEKQVTANGSQPDHPLLAQPKKKRECRRRRSSLY